MNPDVDWYFTKEGQWQTELQQLRRIVVAYPLAEALKWGVPCYTCQHKNVLLLHQFKDYCAMLFMKGALLTDNTGILIQQTTNVQATRQIRFTHLEEIIDLEPRLNALIGQAIAIEKAGLTVLIKPTAEFRIVEEFEGKLALTPALKVAFEALTPGRQRAYLLFFAAPKQAKTREARIEKCMPQILAGKGLND